MEIRETIMSRAFSVMDEDPYLLALKAMEEISRSEKVIEKANSYESDGPHHRAHVEFEAIDQVDDFSKITFNFNMTGEDGMLRVSVNGLLDTHIDEIGFFGNTFADHYAQELFPMLRKFSDERVGFFGSKIHEIFEAQKKNLN